MHEEQKEIQLWVHLFEAGSATEFAHDKVALTISKDIADLRAAIVDRFRLKVAPYTVTLWPTRMPTAKGELTSMVDKLHTVKFESDASGFQMCGVVAPKRVRKRAIEDADEGDVPDVTMEAVKAESKVAKKRAGLDTRERFLKLEGPVEERPDLAVVPLADLGSFQQLCNLVKFKISPLIYGPYQSGKTTHLHALKTAFPNCQYYYVSLASVQENDSACSFVGRKLHVEASSWSELVDKLGARTEGENRPLLCLDEVDLIRERDAEWREFNDLVKRVTDQPSPPVIIVCAGTFLLREDATPKVELDSLSFRSPWNSVSVVEVSFFSFDQTQHLLPECDDPTRATNLIFGRVNGHPSLTTWLVWKLVNFLALKDGFAQFVTFIQGPTVVQEAMILPSIKQGFLERMRGQTQVAMPLLMQFVARGAIPTSEFSNEEVHFHLTILRGLGIIQQRGLLFEFYSGLVRDVAMRAFVPGTTDGIVGAPEINPKALAEFFIFCLKLVNIRALTAQNTRAVDEYQWQFEIASSAKKLLPSRYVVTAETWVVEKGKRLDMLISNGVVDVGIEFGADMRTEVEVRRKVVQARDYRRSDKTVVVVMNFVPAGTGVFYPGGHTEDVDVMLVVYDLSRNSAEIWWNGVSRGAHPLGESA